MFVKGCVEQLLSSNGVSYITFALLFKYEQGLIVCFSYKTFYL